MDKSGLKLDDDSVEILLSSISQAVLVPHIKVACFFFFFITSLFIAAKYSSLSFPSLLKPAHDEIDIDSTKYNPFKGSDLFRRFTEDWKEITNKIRVALDGGNQPYQQRRPIPTISI